jgi:alkylation response protein AidB-like acyl-CoA dehydrogenase
MARGAAIRQNPTPQRQFASKEGALEMRTNSTAEEIANRMISEVEPVLRKYAAQAEADRRLAPEAITAILDAGLMTTWTPKHYGGLEMHPIPAFKMFEALARIDSAAGWIVATSCGIASFSWYPVDANKEMRADQRGFPAGSWFPPGTAEPVEGGYRVSGQWSFGSGCDYANWLTGQALVMENGRPKIGPGGKPEALIVFFRASEATIIDTWHTLGMRGTGSNDVRIKQVFIPERRSWKIAPLTVTDPAFNGPLYRLGLWIVGPLNASVALGIARAALDDLIALAEKKTPSYTQTGLADRSAVQERVARARALIEAGSGYIETAVARAWDFVLKGQKLDIEYGSSLALAGSFSHDAACQAVDLVHSCAGTTGIRQEHRFQQYFRDVHTVSQHAFSSWNRFESIGKLMLGRESDWAFYYL